jgi:hypothetical protein
VTPTIRSKKTLRNIPLHFATQTVTRGTCGRKKGPYGYHILWEPVFFNTNIEDAFETI